MGSYKGVISPLIRVISIVTLLITLLFTTHEPRSRVQGFNSLSLRRRSFRETYPPNWKSRTLNISKTPIDIYICVYIDRYVCMYVYIYVLMCLRIWHPPQVLW